ncbi:hypothetical protein PG2113B_0279 [Bifidobacterium pseudolongum subsp. globosum]|uniref:hypothetical protein n=1 Tax=Bifidobacterium pseudolongum TaxID=1694 RepID=UPI001020ABB8|nr:hypothetical protein [Bifidobacterium pseudolongum]RYQ05356.1 hypothetical protein PG2113B_0279 [Bifidobacterium pseudolongum subsp. globosum]RYQ10816.1 hypothetical protein PG2098B_0278 [Bifidobacterium pseudolongum subsp. globosum]RYQ15149.1 hypothetical protein PG2088B_0278 [Bifidobacterium pseudolongum subsp. globosum]RYQ16796.1 hypothetical protein PG2086B_0278 [Bifidobacterium pseudolongum subsp. globosum]
MNDNTSENTPQTADTAHDDHDGKLAAEAARRRVQAKEANERADAAEATVADLRAQIAALKLSQAKQAVTAAHPELTPELIDEFAPEGIDADGLADWAEKSLGLVVALRGEKEPDVDSLSDAERELAETKMQLARQEAIATNEHVTVDVLDALCGADTPDGLAEWAATFEQVAAEIANAKSESFVVRQRFIAGIQANKVGGGKMKRPGSGMEGVAQKLTKR